MVRFASALLLVAIVLGTILWLPPWGTLVVSALVAALAADEVAGLASHAGARVSRLLLASAAALVTVSFAFDHAATLPGVPALVAVLLSLVVASGAMALTTAPDAGTLTRASVTVMAPIYVGLPLGAIAAMRTTDGPGPLLLLLLVIATSDTAQFYTGRTLGRRKLAPVVSPGKTVEGAVGGLVAAALVGVLAGPRLVAVLPASAVACAALGAALALSGIVGDLFESLLKRGAGVKDSSSHIPGHGGVLDRIDGYLFAAPVFYLFLGLMT